MTSENWPVPILASLLRQVQAFEILMIGGVTDFVLSSGFAAMICAMQTRDSNTI
jgi:hypothetical protein